MPVAHPVARRSRSRRKPPWARRSTNRREKILWAASRVFHERGFEAASLDDVAAVSDISKAGIYYHFRDKKGLLAETMRLILRQFEEARAQVIAAGLSAQEALREIVHMHALMIAPGITPSTTPQYSLSLEIDIVFLDPEDRAEIVSRRRAHWEFLRTLLTQLKREGKLHDVNVTAAAFSIIAMVVWLNTWYKPDGPLSPERVADEVTKLALNSVLKDAGEGVWNGGSHEAEG